MTQTSDSKSVRLSGGCLCGQVRFRASGDPLFVAHCQCTDCRKTSGTGHSTDAGFPSADVVIEGAMNTYRAPAQSGNQILRCFCGVCGTKISTTNSAYPKDIALNLAAFDDPGHLRPTTVYFTQNAIDWDVIDPSLQAFETQP